MTGPEMRESPGGNPLIVWNQPHPIYLAELLYRNSPTPETLAHYRDLVLETADSLAAMVHWNEATQRYDLGPPLWIAQETGNLRPGHKPEPILRTGLLALDARRGAAVARTSRSVARREMGPRHRACRADS
jgi:hypothetical protein